MVTYDRHKIVIDNIKENETVKFSLLLVKGHIVVNNNNYIENSNNAIQVNNNDATSTWPVCNNTFKCLLNLTNGCNKLIFNYFQSKAELEIIYQPRNTKYCVLPLYIICKDHDGLFQAPLDCDNSIDSACSKIALGSRLIQCLTAEKLFEHGYGRKTFQLESDLKVESPKCFPFYSSLSVSKARNMEEEELWTYFGREIMSSEFSSPYRKYLAFLSCTEWQSTGEVKAHAALGGGGLALFGTGCLHTWPSKVEEVAPCFLNTTLVDTTYLMDDSCHRGTYGACFSTTLGAVCHELGHTFDLGHSQEGIMGRGFDNIHLVYLTSSIATSYKYNKSSVRKITAQKSTVQLTNNFNVEYKTGPSINRCNQTPSPRSQRNRVPVDLDNNPIKHEDDETHWSSSCAALLAYHRWFNNESSECKKKSLHYDQFRNILSGGLGIRVIELRGEDGLVLNSWQFPGTKLREQFFVPKQLVNNAQFLVAEDSEGNIIKLKLN